MFKQAQPIAILVMIATQVLLRIDHTQAQEAYQVGDILDIKSLKLAHFETDEPLDLENLEGKILYLEWFYWW